MRSIGIDIAEDSVRVVELTDGVVSYHSCGDERLLRIVKARRPDRIITGIRGSQILTRTYRLTRPQLFAQWLARNVSSVIPGLKPSEVIVSHRFLTSDEVLIGVVRKDRFHQIIKIFLNHDLLPDVVDSSGLPLFYIFRDRLPKDVIIAHFERLSLTTLVVRGGLPITSHYRRLSHRYFSEAISELNTIIDFHRMKSEEILITGPKARQLLRRLIKAGIKARYEAIPSLPPELIIAYGLALRSDEEGLDLLPSELRRRVKLERRTAVINRIRRVVTIGSALLLTFLLIQNLYLRGRIAEGLRNESRLFNSIQSIGEDLPHPDYLGRRDYSTQLSIIGNAVPRGMKLSLICNQIRSGKVKREELRVEGEARDEDRIVKFLTRLKAGGFKLIDVRISEEEGGLSFEITMI